MNINLQKKEFQHLIQKAIDQGHTPSLCNEFELGPSQEGGFGYNTVCRWANGTAHPLPGFKRMIVEFLKERIV